MFGNTGKPIGKFIDTFYLNEKMPKKKEEKREPKKKKNELSPKGGTGNTDNHLVFVKHKKLEK